MSFPRDAFPYTNFHELNLGYFIVHFREIFSQWADLYDQMTDWKDATDEELATWKAGVEADLDQREAALIAELETWKAQTGQDIAGWEDATLAALTAWQTATQAVFEAIRVDAAGSATAAAASAGDAATAKTAAETAQAAAEAAAASIASSAAQIATNTGDIADLKTQIGYTKNYIEGYYVARDGTLIADPDYCSSEFIPLANMPIGFTFYYGLYGGVKTNATFYDSVGSFTGFMGGASGASERNVPASSYPTNSMFVRFGFNKNYAGKIHNARGYTYWTAQKINTLESSVLNYSPKKRNNVNTSDTLATTLLILEQNAIKNPTIFFYGKINSNFTYIDIGHGEGESYTEYFRIDRTNLEIHSGASGVSTVAHGLTLDTYIAVNIAVKSNCDYNIIINTLGGSYSRSFAKPNVWLGYKGSVFARAGTTNSVTPYTFTFTAPYNKNKWLFGDSYLSNYSESRWPYYMQTWGFDNTLINAFPGETAQQAYIDFCSALTHGNPKYVVWALGMNNPDSGAVNADWLNISQLVKIDCENRGIELIFATIPCTPTYDNSYKNTWIKNSGLRYIDFAEAVGAETAGSTWYPGTLEEGTVRTHPTPDGARLLACRALTDFPEFMQE